MTQAVEDLIKEAARGVEAGDWTDLASRLSVALASEKARAEKAEAENAKLREALASAQQQFQGYADAHTDAGKTEKAATNQKFADMCAQTLEETSARSMA